MPAYTTYQRGLGLNREIAVFGAFPTRGDQNGGTMATVAMIHTYGFSYTAPGGAYANGAILAPQSFRFLFAQLGTIYGGDGAHTFGLPNLVGRVSVGWGYGGGTVPVGAELGQASFSLGSANLPESSGGASTSVSVAQPQLATTFVINAKGVFPGGALTYDTIGVVSEFAGNYAPNDSILCDGRLLSILDFPELFSVIGTAYGGDGTTMFAVPDLRGRVIVGVDADHPLGSVTGTDTTAIAQANMPINMGGLGTAVSLDGPEIALRQIVITTGSFPARSGNDGDTSIPFIGEILTFAGSVAVGGGSDARGQILSIAEHQELFMLFGTTYGGDGETTFGLPDLGDRAVVGIGSSPGAGIPGVSIGQQIGVSDITLSSADFGPLSIIGTVGDDARWGGDANDTIDGASGNDTLYGNRGNDVLTGGRGDDIIDGGAGFDVVSYADATAAITATLGPSGAAQNTGGAGIDTLRDVEKLIGSDYDDVLTLATVVAPGPLVVDNSVDHGSIGSAVQTDQAFAAGAGGTPHVIANVTGSSQKYFQFTVTEAGTATFSVNNASFDSQIQLYNSNNAFIGGSGFSSNHYYFSRSLAPGTYYVTFGSGSAADTATYTFDISVPGHTVAFTAAALDGGAGDDTLTGGAGIDTLTGGSGIDTLIGGLSDDLLDGGTGADRMTGGAGDDMYVVDNALDRAVELAGGGYDRVASNVTFHLNSNVEALTLTGTAAIDGYGNADANAIVGNDMANVLGGKDGDDTLTGAGGADVLDGGRGADTMTGGADNDVYYVDAAGDQVIEVSGGGADKVSTSIDYTLPDQVETLILTGTARSGTGNALDNAITGTSGNDMLSGLDGADTLKGGAGNDTIIGGIGNDVIFGGAGRDMLTGGAGADRFAFLTGDSGPASALTDRITDFSHAEADRVALNQIDANSATPADNAFGFIGTSAFHNVAGELRYSFAGADTLIEGDTNGDGVADLAIRLTGHVTLVAGDFVL